MSIYRYALHARHPDVECVYGSHSSVELALIPFHAHQFHEMFLVVSGAIRHCVNGVESLLTEGDCVYIRPDDQHQFLANPGIDGRIINVEFSAQVFEALALFLGDGMPMTGLSTAPLPAVAHLDAAEKERVQGLLEELNWLPALDSAAANAGIRSLLAQVFTRHFRPATRAHASMPVWLDVLCRAMDKRENFVGGVPRMAELSHKSLEHLCRSCRRYLSCTPSELVNTRRLNYAANLLAHSDAKVSWIARQSGFANLSHFYTRFAKAYKMTPARFRQMRAEGRGLAN